MLCPDLSLSEKWGVRRHLKKCPHCRARQVYLEESRTQRMLQLYGNVIRDEDIQLSEKPRADFILWLKVRVREAVPKQPRVPRFSFVLRTVSTGATLGVLAAAFAFFFWRPQNVAEISADTFLVRAAKWETPGHAINPGVAHQAVRIKTQRQTIDRSIYWDPQGTRIPKHVTLSISTEKLRSELSRAGVDWDRPISAYSYQTWHDQQAVREDRVTRTGTHLLTLTTAVTDSTVAKESLTVRDSDFHPVVRTVAFRDNETVEIAELDFNILPWNAVDTNVFEPIGSILQTQTAVEPHLSSLHFPEIPSPGQLDEIELSARLILNQLHADTGEQIEVHRSSQGVEVDGLVDTEERKRELKTQLAAVPRLKFSIQSMTDLRSSPMRSDESISVQTASLPDHPSALEIYLKAQGSGVADINALAQKFFNIALRICQESRAIVDLKTRFVHEQTSLIASATLAELLYSHHERLEEALQQERALLSETKRVPDSINADSMSDGLSLTDAATRNLSFTKELTETNAPVQRSAEEIFADMSVMTSRLTTAAHEVYGRPLQDTADNRKR